MKFNEKEIIEACGAEVLKSIGNVCSFGISTDTRTIKEGEIYLPLKGETFDGENFIQQALDKGASGYFTTRGGIFENACAVYKVDDTLKAYLCLARFIRRKFNPITVAITGSSGKTTTKEMVYAVLSQKFKTHKTLSNHNNEIGLCQTILGMEEDTECLIVEMGMRGLGEIELLSKYSEPDYAIITNAGSAHLGRLGSLDNIAKAKSEIVKYLNPSGSLIANDNPRLKNFTSGYGGEKIWFSIKDVQILEQRQGYSKYLYKDREYELNVEGAYNIENSLSAIETGYKLGMTYDEVKAGLLAYHPIEKRWEAEKIGGFNVINDSYNANPESMKASVTTFINLYDNPVVVLGNMGELGEQEAEIHFEVGKFIANDIKNNPSAKGKKVIFLTVGKLAGKIGEPLTENGFFVKNFENNQDAARCILDNIDAGCTIFLKASRAMRFEEIIEYLRENSKS